MKVRVYDSGKSAADRYTLYFPYPKRLREHEGRTIMGCFQPFNFVEGQLTLYAWDYDDRSLGYNIPRNEKKVKNQNTSSIRAELHRENGAHLERCSEVR